MAAGAFSAQGYFSFPFLIFIGIMGNIAGDNSGYWLARHYGSDVLKKIGFRKVLSNPKFTVVERYIETHPLLTISVSRYLTGIAPTVNVIAGLSKTHYLKYLTFEMLGEIAEVSTYAGIGFFFGSDWEALNGITRYFWIAMVAGVIFTSLIWKRLGKHHSS